VVHTHLAYSDLLGGAAARSLGLPTVSTLHVMQWDGPGRERLKEPLYAAARRRCAQRVVTVSDAARQAYLATGRDKPDRVVTVRNGIVGRSRRGAGARVRRELGIRADETVVAMVAVLRPGKGHDVAIEAMERLRTEHPGTRLLILGDGPNKAEIMARARRLGDAVIFAGHRDDVLDVLDATDVLVHPTFHDAFPTALLEAMCARVPVIATAVGGIPEIVEDGVTGLTLSAPPASWELEAALRRLLREPEARRVLGCAARDRFDREFTAERWGQRLRGLYQAVVSE
jgi:glycosyltransferase involved in cell wall biosynthesis